LPEAVVFLEPQDARLPTLESRDAREDVGAHLGVDTENRREVSRREPPRGAFEGELTVDGEAAGVPERRDTVPLHVEVETGLGPNAREAGVGERFEVVPPLIEHTEGACTELSPRRPERRTDPAPREFLDRRRGEEVLVQVVRVREEELDVIRESNRARPGNGPLTVFVKGAGAEDEPWSSKRAFDLVASVLLRDPELDPLGVHEETAPVADDLASDEEASSHADASFEARERSPVVGEPVPKICQTEGSRLVRNRWSPQRAERVLGALAPRAGEKRQERCRQKRQELGPKVVAPRIRISSSVGK
jgi:hypothetical protein